MRYKVFPRLKFRGTGIIDIKEADTMYLIANFYKWDCGVDPPESTYVTHELFVHPKQMTNDEFYKDFVIAPEYFYFDNDMDYVTFELTFTVFANGIKCGCAVPMRYGFPAEFEDYYSKDVAGRDDPRYVYYDVYIDMGNLEYNCDGTP
ncbi:MAG: hypothetical protein V2I62_09270 [Bacteroidales bacterium]|nr:hypothetical protein [Bacteroidales bacterium]